METISDAALRINGSAGIAGIHHGGDARDVRPERKSLKIEHDLEVIIEGFGNSNGSGGQFQVFGRLFLGFLNAAFDLANVVEVVGQSSAIGRRQFHIQRRDLVLHGIKQAARLLFARQPFLRSAALSEQLFKQDLGIMFHGQRQGGRLPSDGVRVRASITGSAVQAVLFDGSFQRRQRRILPEFLRHDLIDGGSNVDGRLFRMSTAQEDRGRTRVVGARIASDSRGLAVRQVAYDHQTVPVFLQRLQNFRELEAAAFLSRSPLVHGGAVRHVDACQAAARTGGRSRQKRLRRHHGIQQRKRDCNAGPAQERSAWKMFFRDEVHGCSPVTALKLVQHGRLHFGSAFADRLHFHLKRRALYDPQHDG